MPSRSSADRDQLPGRAREADVERPGQRARADRRAARSRDGQQPRLEAIAQRRDTRRASRAQLGARPAAPPRRSRRCRRRSRCRRRRSRSWWPPATSGSNGAPRRRKSAPDALRPVELVRRERQRVDAQRARRRRAACRPPARRRCGTARRAPRATRRQRRDVVDVAELVVGERQRHQRRVRRAAPRAAPRDRSRPSPSTGSSVTSKRRARPASAPSTDGCSSGDDTTCGRAPTLAARAAGGGRQARPRIARLSAFGAARGEDDLLGRRADERRDLARARCSTAARAARPAACTLDGLPASSAAPRASPQRPRGAGAWSRCGRGRWGAHGSYQWAGVAARKACPLLSPLPQTGEGTGGRLRAHGCGATPKRRLRLRRQRQLLLDGDGGAGEAGELPALAPWS